VPDAGAGKTQRVVSLNAVEVLVLTFVIATPA
jgi:hypothetical protein